MTKSRYHDLRASLSKGSGASSLLRKYNRGGLTPTQLNALSMAGTFAGGAIDKATTKTTTDVNGVEYQTQDAGSAALSGAMKGASMGATLGPWGALAGGLIYGTYGAITANQQNKEIAAKKATALNEANINAEELGRDNLSAAKAMGFNSKGGYSSIYKKGGYINKYPEGGAIPNPEYEVEGNEVVQGQDTQLEGQQQLASDMTKAVGPTHENGGVMGAGGERVFSDRLSISPTLSSILSAAKIPVKSNATYASVAEKLGKLKGKYEEKSKSGNSLANRTGKVMNERINSFIELTFQDQEFSKQEDEQNQMFAKGGELPDWNSLNDPNYVPDNSPVRVQNAGSYVAPEKAAVVEQIVNNPAVNQTKKPAKVSTNANSTGGIHDNYSIGSYATAPDHEKIVNLTYKKIKSKGALTEDVLDTHMQASVRKGKKVPFTAKQVIAIANQYGVEPEALAAIIQTDSSYGTEGKGARTFNPGNVGNDDSGKTVNYGNWDAGLEAAAKWLAKHKKTKKVTPASSNATQNNGTMKFYKGGRIKKYYGGGPFDIEKARKDFAGLSDDTIYEIAKIRDLASKYPVRSSSIVGKPDLLDESYVEPNNINDYRDSIKSKLKPDLLDDSYVEPNDINEGLDKSKLKPDLLTDSYVEPNNINDYRDAVKSSRVGLKGNKSLGYNTMQPPSTLSRVTNPNISPINKPKTFVASSSTIAPPVLYDVNKKTDIYNPDKVNKPTESNQSTFANDFFTGDQAINLGVYMANLNNAGKRKTGYNREVARPSYMRRNNMLPYMTNQIKAEADVVNKGIDRTSGNVQDVFARKAAVYANTTEALNNAAMQQQAADNQVYNTNLGIANDYRNRKTMAKNADTEDRIINENAIMTNKQNATNAWLSGVMGNLASKRSYDVEKEKLAIARINGERGTAERNADTFAKQVENGEKTPQEFENITGLKYVKGKKYWTNAKGGYIKRKGGYR